MTDKPDRSALKFDYDIQEELPDYMGPEPSAKSAFADALRVLDHLGFRDGGKSSAWARFLWESVDEKTRYQGAVSAHGAALGSKKKGWRFQTLTDKKDPCIVWVRKVALK